MTYCKYCMRPLRDDSVRFCPVCGKNQDTQTLPHQLPPGTLLNHKFELGAVLGQGGFGITYVGRDRNLDLRVAVKEYYPYGVVNRVNTVSPEVTCLQEESKQAFFRKGKTRFLDEARALAKFSGNRGIVDVRDFFEENGTAYIVMEYLDGQTLKAHLKAHGKLTQEETLLLLTPVMETLAALHREDVIHRDISPDNIMLTKNGVKLLDFGSARSVGDEQRSLSVMLKPGYAPEEQYRSHGKQGPWTDVYALCATMYNCLTGVRPVESTERIWDDHLKAPSALGISIDEGFERALLKGLSVRADDRWQNIDDLLSALTPGRKIPLPLSPMPGGLPKTEYKPGTELKPEPGTELKPEPGTELKPEPTAGETEKAPAFGVDPKGTPRRASPLPPGTLLDDRYRLLEKVCSSDTAITYRAELLRDKKTENVIVRELFPFSCAERSPHSALVRPQSSSAAQERFQEARKKFRRECRRLKLLSDETETKWITDYFEANGTIYTVADAEMWDGIPLTAYLRQKPFTEAEVKALFFPVLKTLSTIHSLKYYHLNITPENLLVFRGQARLLGCEKVFYPNFDSKTAVQPVPGYSAIELSDPAFGKPGARADVYSLCASMYSCLTGVRPPDAKKRFPVDPLKAPSDLGAAVTPLTEAAILKGLSVRPENRYATVKDLLTDLQKTDAPKKPALPAEEKTIPLAEEPRKTEPAAFSGGAKSAEKKPEPAETTPAAPAVPSDELEKMLKLPKAFGVVSLLLVAAVAISLFTDSYTVSFWDVLCPMLCNFSLVGTALYFCRPQWKGVFAGICSLGGLASVLAYPLLFAIGDAADVIAPVLVIGFLILFIDLGYIMSLSDDRSKRLYAVILVELLLLNVDYFLIMDTRAQDNIPLAFSFLLLLIAAVIPLVYLYKSGNGDFMATYENEIKGLLQEEPEAPAFVGPFTAVLILLGVVAFFFGIWFFQNL